VDLKILEAVGVYGSDKAAAHHLAISVEWVERCLQSLRDKNGMADEGAGVALLGVAGTTGGQGGMSELREALDGVYAGSVTL
jgi:hypothetical protein